MEVETYLGLEGASQVECVFRFEEAAIGRFFWGIAWPWKRPLIGQWKWRWKFSPGFMDLRVIKQTSTLQSEHT